MTDTLYYQPKSVDEALQIKAELGAEGTFLAGGTDVVVGIRKGKLKVARTIDLSQVPGLDGIRRHDGFLEIGAMTTHKALEQHDVPAALAQSCETVGGPQIRYLGTVGGQIGTASPAGDVSVALIALKADVELRSAARGTRRLPLDEVFVGPGKTVIADDEMVTRVFVPLGRRSDFYKIGKRDAVAISLVMAAASVGPAGDVAIAIGCVAPVPLRIKRAEALLDARGLSDEAVDEAATIAREDCSPISDHRGGADYRRAMAGTLTKRLLSRLREVTPVKAKPAESSAEVA
ncbi:MAG: xanthine dehydrogenase family protein subunit M [Myxococcales bacterium]|nr:xanthine dehydrogenase family protein subunit M [Myxococcales bacterium]